MSEPRNPPHPHNIRPDELLDQAPYGIVVLDESSRIRTWNAQMVTWTGLQANDVADLPIVRVFPEFERPRYRMRLDTLVDQGTPVVFHGTVNRGLLRMRSGSVSLPHYRVTCRRCDVSGGTVLWIENATLLQETIDYLREEIGARRRAEEELRGALDSRDILYRELQHRVKNSLSLISSLVSLAQSEVYDEAAEASLRDIRARIDSIGLVYEQLSGGGAYGEVDLGLYLTRLLDTLNASIGWPSRVQEPRTAFDSCAVPVDTAVCIGLIVNELVTNAVKHAFPNGREGSIEVTLSSGDGVCDLSIADDGVGAAGGLGDAEGQRLGLGLVELLADQIGGALERSPGPGTAYRLRFRLDAVPTIADGEENAAPDGYSRSNT